MVSTLLSELIPVGFMTLVIAHFIALVSPGADFFLISGYAIRHGFRSSYGLVIGVAVGHGGYIALAMIGWTLLKTYPKLFATIQALGIIYLLYLGILLINSQNTAVLKDQARAPSVWRHQLIMGGLTALLNPKNFIFYMSLMAAILGPEITMLQQIVAGLWMFIVVLTWDLFMAYCVGHPRVIKILGAKLFWIERISGAIIIIIACGIAMGMIMPLFF